MGKNWLQWIFVDLSVVQQISYWGKFRPLNVNTPHQNFCGEKSLRFIIIESKPFCFQNIQLLLLLKSTKID